MVPCAPLSTSTEPLWTDRLAPGSWDALDARSFGARTDRCPAALILQGNRRVLHLDANGNRCADRTVAASPAGPAQILVKGYSWLP
jgi:hypothetical protein